MTIKKLHKLLGSLIDQGHSRKPVYINKGTFTHPLESDGCIALKIVGGSIQWIPTIDDDGFQKYRKDNSECGTHCFVLEGE